MATATLSSKFQISIPKAIREQMDLKPGQKFVFIRRGQLLQLVPQPTLNELFGIAKGANPDDYRDRTDRFQCYSRHATARRAKK